MDELKALVNDITAELSSFRKEVENLPETLELPENSPLRYMLTPEGERLDRMLSRCERLAEEEEIRNLISEYARLNEILASHKEIHHDIDADGQVIKGLTEKLEILQQHFSKLCQLLGH